MSIDSHSDNDLSVPFSSRRRLRLLHPIHYPIRQVERLDSLTFKFFPKLSDTYVSCLHNATPYEFSASGVSILDGNRPSCVV